MNRYQFRLLNGCLWLMGLIFLAALSFIRISIPEVKSLDTWVDGRFARNVELQYNDNFMLKEWFINIWAALNYSFLGEGQTGVIVGKDGWLFTQEEFQWNNSSKINLDSSISEIVKTYNYLRSKGLLVELILIPPKAEIYSDKLIPSSIYSHHNLHTLVTTELIKNGVAVKDLSPVLKDARKVADSFMRTDTHWTPLGAEYVAKAISKHMNRNNSLGNYITQVKSKITYRGDLLNYIPVFPNLTKFGPNADNLELMVLTAVESSNSDDLLSETDPIEQVLIGTSYSANDNWNFAGALKQYTGQDLINFSEEGKGPFLPMRNWLQRKGEDQLGLKVVFWEIPVRYLIQSK